MNKREKKNLRKRDRYYFYSLLGHRYMEGLQIDHDWKNSVVYTRLLTREEHRLIARKRGEWFDGYGR